MRSALEELIPIVGVRAACAALDIPRASFYRKGVSGGVPPAADAAVRFVPRALEPAERNAVLACLHEERFQNCAPAAVYATLLDEGRYHCSIRTMYRILAGEGETRERRDQLAHPAYTKPELLATGPNQLWSWDITKLLGPAKWTYFYLYVILDVLTINADAWSALSWIRSSLRLRLWPTICGGLDGRRWRERGTGQTADCGHLRQAGNRTGETDDSCGPGFFDDVETRRVPDGGSGNHQNPQPAACLRR